MEEKKQGQRGGKPPLRSKKYERRRETSPTAKRGEGGSGVRKGHVFHLRQKWRKGSTHFSKGKGGPRKKKDLPSYPSVRTPTSERGKKKIRGGEKGKHTYSILYREICSSEESLRKRKTSSSNIKVKITGEKGNSPSLISCRGRGKSLGGESFPYAPEGRRGMAKLFFSDKRASSKKERKGKGRPYYFHTSLTNGKRRKKTLISASKRR